jgi:fructosamine-3-kinase
MTTRVIDKCIDFLHTLHNTNYPIFVDKVLVKANYIDKLKERFNHNDYYFDDADTVFQEILNGLTDTFNAVPVPIIHGDFWFSNIMLTYEDELKCLDMKGQLYGQLTLNGDMYYDYGKMYQSILGFDLILNRIPLDQEYISKMKVYFLERLAYYELDLQYLKWVTKSLIFGTFHALKPDAPKEKIWELIKSI